MTNDEPMNPKGVQTYLVVLSPKVGAISGRLMPRAISLLAANEREAVQYACYRVATELYRPEVSVVEEDEDG